MAASHSTLPSVNSSSPAIAPDDSIKKRENLLNLLTCVLEQLTPHDCNLPKDTVNISLFHTSEIPSISIGDYLKRIAHYANISDQSLIHTCIMIYSLAKNGENEVKEGRIEGDMHPRVNHLSQQPFRVSIFNIHRLLLTALLVTSKFVDDKFYNNFSYAQIGGVSLKEINYLEFEYLRVIDCNLYLPLNKFIEIYDEFNAPNKHSRCSHAMCPHINTVEDDPALEPDIYDEYLILDPIKPKDGRECLESEEPKAAAIDSNLTSMPLLNQNEVMAPTPLRNLNYSLRFFNNQTYGTSRSQPDTFCCESTIPMCITPLSSNKIKN